MDLVERHWLPSFSIMLAYTVILRGVLVGVMFMFVLSLALQSLLELISTRLP